MKHATFLFFDYTRREVPLQQFEMYTVEMTTFLYFFPIENALPMRSPTL